MELSVDRVFAAQGEKVRVYIEYMCECGAGVWESAMAHQYKAGDVVTVFQISSAKELVIEGKATIRTRVAEVRKLRI